MAEDRSVLIAWCEMKAADCEREVAMAEGVGMANLATRPAREARYYRAIIAALLRSGSAAADISVSGEGLACDQSRDGQCNRGGVRSFHDAFPLSFSCCALAEPTVWAASMGRLLLRLVDGMNCKVSDSIEK